MEFSEYVQMSTGGEIIVKTYSYHCTDHSGNLLVRWDNTPHFPELPGFPHHMHIGSDENVQPSQCMNIFEVLKNIKAYLK